MKRIMVLFLMAALILCGNVKTHAWLTKTQRNVSDPVPNGRSSNDLFYDGFDEEEEGMAPAGWTATYSRVGYGSILVADISDDKNPQNGAMAIADTDTVSYNGTTAIRKCPPQKGRFAIELKFAVSAETAEYVNIFNFRVGSESMANILIRDGLISLRSTANTIPVATAKQMEYNKATLIVDPHEKSLDAVFVMGSSDTPIIIKDFATDDVDLSSGITDILIQLQLGTSTLLFDYVKIELNHPGPDEGERRVLQAPIVDDPVPHPIPNAINVNLDGKYKYFVTRPVLVNSRVMMSYRELFELLGMSVSWDEGEKKATALSETKKIEITPEAELAAVDGVKKELGTPALIIENRLFVPLRFVAEAVGAYVEWEEDTQTVFIITEGEAEVK